MFQIKKMHMSSENRVKKVEHFDDPTNSVSDLCFFEDWKWNIGNIRVLHPPVAIEVSGMDPVPLWGTDGPDTLRQVLKPGIGYLQEHFSSHEESQEHFKKQVQPVSLWGNFKTRPYPWKEGDAFWRDQLGRSVLEVFCTLCWKWRNLRQTSEHCVSLLKPSVFKYAYSFKLPSWTTVAPWQFWSCKVALSGVKHKVCEMIPCAAHAQNRCTQTGRGHLKSWVRESEIQGWEGRGQQVQRVLGSHSFLYKNFHENISKGCHFSSIRFSSHCCET